MIIILTKLLFWQQTTWLEHCVVPRPMAVIGLQVSPLSRKLLAVDAIFSKTRTYTLPVRLPRTIPRRPARVCIGAEVG